MIFTQPDTSKTTDSTPSKPPKTPNYTVTEADQSSKEKDSSLVQNIKEAWENHGWVLSVVVTSYVFADLTAGVYRWLR